jgi:hypothetical protein
MSACSDDEEGELRGREGVVVVKKVQDRWETQGESQSMAGGWPGGGYHFLNEGNDGDL